MQARGIPSIILLFIASGIVFLRWYTAGGNSVALSIYGGPQYCKVVRIPEPWDVGGNNALYRRPASGEGLLISL